MLSNSPSIPSNVVASAMGARDDKLENNATLIASSAAPSATIQRPTFMHGSMRRLRMRLASVMVAVALVGRDRL